MKSFKKIALALVAALTMSTLVVTPASANTVSVDVTTEISGAGTAASPFTVKVPSDNVVSVADTATVTNNEALLLTATVVAGTPVTFTAVGNVKLVSAIGATVSASAGSSTITVTPASTTASVYAFTTSTSASAVTVSVVGASTTVYLKGVAGPAYDLKMSVPASGNISGKVTATFDVADIFGNAVSETVTVTTLGGATAGSVTADALVPGRYSADITLPAAAGTVAVGATIATPTSVPTIKLATVSQTAIVTVSDLATALAAEKAARAADKAAADKALADAVAKAAADAAIAKAAADAAALTAAAEIAKLKADAVTAKLTADKALADAAVAHATELAKVKADNDAAIAAMKKAFNALAAKWNKANPKAKVALVK
jgi:hypothetical protein